MTFKDSFNFQDFPKALEPCLYSSKMTKEDKEDITNIADQHGLWFIGV